MIYLQFMDETIIKQIDIYIQDSIREFQQNRDAQHKCIFDRFIERCQFYYDKPAHSLGEIKLKMNKKLKGDIFEHFCLKYCQHVLGFKQVWLLGDVPPEILTKLSLRSHDLGIDLIACDDKGDDADDTGTEATHAKRYQAIQAKYRKRNTYKQQTALSWNQLSTFHALVSRTGPFDKHIIITNADYCRQFGRKTSKDKSICYGTLKNLSVSEWMAMAGMRGRRLDRIPTPIVKLKSIKEDLLLDPVHREELSSESLVGPSDKSVVDPPAPAVPQPTTTAEAEIRSKRLAFLDKISKI